MGRSLLKCAGCMAKYGLLPLLLRAFWGWNPGRTGICLHPLENADEGWVEEDRKVLEEAVEGEPRDRSVERLTVPGLRV